MPKPLSLCAQFLIENSLEEEGLFRIPGSHAKVNEWQLAFDKGETPVFGPYEGSNVASLFIRFLRELPTLYDGSKKDIMTGIENHDVNGVYEAMLSMHICYRELFRLMVDLCIEIAKHSEKNQMTIKNLGICFGPALSIMIPFLAENYQCFPNTKVYGVTVEEAVKNSNNGIVEPGLLPSPIELGIKCIESFGMDDDQVYKESGNFTKVKEYRLRLNNGEKFDYDPADVNVATSLIHSFYRDLKEDLFCGEKAFKNLHNINENERTNVAQELILTLPLANRNVIVLFSRHLHNIISHSKTMDLLSICETLGPGFDEIFRGLIPISINLNFE